MIVSHQVNAKYMVYAVLKKDSVKHYPIRVALCHKRVYYKENANMIKEYVKRLLTDVHIHRVAKNLAGVVR